jgi:acyl carrier protein
MVFEKLRELICDEFELDAECVTMESVLMCDLGVDSIDLVDLGMTVEDVFEVEMHFDDEDLEKIKTVGDLVKYIEENK